MAKKYCINCGQLVPESAKFCSHCGAPQHGMQAGKFRADEPTVDLGQVALDETVEQDNVINSQGEQAKSTYANKTREEKEHIFQAYHKKQSLGKNAVIAFFISYVVKTAILLPLLFIALVFDPLFGLLGIGIYVLALYITAMVIYSSFYYWVDDHSFHKSYGIIHKKDVSIPYQQIQNVNINRSLTDRMLGLSRISIETAGNNATKDSSSNVSSVTSSAEGYIPGVDLQCAKEVHDLLLVRADEAS